MINETVALGSSPIHRLDPRIRIISAAAFSIVVALAERFPVLLLALLISVLMHFSARLDSRLALKRLKAILLFLIMLWVILPVTYQGPTLSVIGPLTLTRPGVVLAAQISLKSITILWSLIALVATIPFAATGQALQQLKVPSKMVLLLLMTYRYLFVIEQEYQRIMRAVHIRGFKPQTRLHTYKTYAYIIGMLFVRAFARADRVNKAMLCRGFKGRFYSLQSFSITARDRWFAAAMFAFTGTMIWLEWIKAG
jgi:cobalt/nickel transport system permease protein